MEAWKQKQAAERDRKQRELEIAGGTRGLLNEIDKKAQVVPAVAAPVSPETPDKEVSPAPYAGKFDPKAIVRRATAGSAGVTKLGTDVALPEIAKASAINSTTTGFKADKTLASAKKSLRMFLPSAFSLSRG